nr:MAG TPA: hypothetical protein [Caudoviricetes sp.]
MRHFAILQGAFSYSRQRYKMQTISPLISDINCQAQWSHHI